MKQQRTRILADLIEKTPAYHIHVRQAYREDATIRSCKTLDDVIELLHSADPGTRKSIAWFLGALGDKRAVGPLIKALKHDDDLSVRQQCADSLGILGGKRGVMPLLHALQHDPDVAIRERAASALRFLKDPRIIDVLISVMRNQDEEPIVREMVAEAMICPDLHKAVPTLINALSDDAPNVRYWSATTLAMSKDPSALAALERLAREDTAVVYEPGNTPALSLCWGSVSTAAATAMIKIKQDCDLPLTAEETQYVEEKDRRLEEAHPEWSNEFVEEYQDGAANEAAL